MIKPFASTSDAVVIPLDGSEFASQAVPFAKAIAATTDRFVLLQVLPETIAFRGVFGTEIFSAEDVQRANEDAARAHVDSVRHTHFSDSERVVEETVVGEPAEEILRSVDRHGAKMIVLATHGHEGIERMIIGSVADRIARAATVPVLLIRPTYPVADSTSAVELTRIVVPLDGSPLAAEAIPVAQRLAKQLKVPIALITVFELPRAMSSALAYGAAYNAWVYQELLDQGAEEARAMLDREAGSLRAAGCTVETSLLEGQVHGAVAMFTGPNDLIVMTSHGRSGLARWLLGSVATKVIHQGGTPVLLVPSSVRRDRRDAAEAELPIRATEQPTVLEPV